MQGVTVSNDFHALSTLVQWVWRSAVRRPSEEGGPLPIHVYIPSRRMRKLFERYLQGHLPDSYRQESVARNPAQKLAVAIVNG